MIDLKRATDDYYRIVFQDVMFVKFEYNPTYNLAKVEKDSF